MISLPGLLLPKIRYFGLSIDFDSLCAIELNENKEPIHVAQIQLPQGTFDKGQLINSENFIRSVQALYKSGGFISNYVSVTFPEIFAYTRGIDIPEIANDDLNEAISWQAKDLFPFPSDEIYFDSKVLSKIDNKVKVTIVAIQRKILDPLITCLIKSGLKPLRFEPDAQAISRMLGLTGDEQAILVEKQKTGAYVTLVNGDKSLFTTTVLRLNNDTDSNLDDNLKKTINEIVLYYKNKGELIEKNTCLVVTGEAISNEWVGNISRELGFSAKRLKTKFGKSIIDKSYATASYPIQPPSNINSINLLPQQTQGFYDNERHKAFYKALYFRAIIIVSFFLLISILNFIYIQLKKSTLEANINNLNQVISSAQTDTKKLLYLNNQAKSVVTLAPLKKTPGIYIEELKNLINEDININSWDFDDTSQEFKIYGQAKTRSALLEFKERIDNSEFFSKATIPLGTLETPILVDFSMTFKLEK